MDICLYPFQMAHVLVTETTMLLPFYEAWKLWNKSAIKIKNNEFIFFSILYDNTL